MKGLLVFIAALVLVAWLIRWDAADLRRRVEWAVAGFGVDYRPSKAVCLVVAAAIFYLIFGIIIER